MKIRKLSTRISFLLVSIVIGLGATVGIVNASGPVHWGYDGAEGPENWGELSEEFVLCSTGTEQSPIDIPSSAPTNPADIVFSYQPSAVNILNNGHTIQINYDAGSSIELNGKIFNLLQFHFHALSENTLDGVPSDLEAHLVHQSDDGEFAVVGVLMNRGAENATLASVWDNLPAQEAEVATISGATINVEEMLPGDRVYYRFNGSFTTPPCTEGVNWLVMAAPIELSDGQAAAFEQIFDHNYRPVQPFNDRAFLQSAELGAVTLPETGAQSLPWGMMLVSFGLIATGTGIFLHYRNSSRTKILR